MESIKQILDAWAIDREKVLIENYHKKGLKASGNFERTLHHETTDNELVIKGQLYVGAMVFGRKPTTKGTEPGELKAIIRKWIDDKGISPYADKNGKAVSKDSLAFIITRSIHNKGTLLYQGKSKNDGRLLLDTFTKESVNTLMGQISRNYITTIKSDVQTTWQQ